MIKIKVNDVEYPLREYSLTITEQVNERSTCSFSLKCKIGDTIEKGMPVYIYDLDDKKVETTIFRGFINDATHKDYINGNVRLYSISCVDMHYLLDKRVFAKGFVNTSSGDIIRTMVENVLGAEGISVTSTSIQEGTVVPYMTFSYVSCNEVMNRLAEMSGYVWYVDYTGLLHFKPMTAGMVSHTVTDDIIIENTLKIANKNNQYRNRQYLKGAVGETGIITQNFKGDGMNRVYSLGYKLSDKPDIYINNVKVDYDDVVIKGYNETAKWYYQKQDNTILQNPEHEPLKATDELKVVYVGSYPIIAITESQSEVYRMSALGSGTGLVEVVDNDTDINTISTALTVAVGKLHKYGGNTYEVTFTTRKSYFEVGQVIDFNSRDWKDNQYLVESVEITDECESLWYTVKAVKGALSDTWTRAFGKGLHRGETVANSDLSEQETVILSRNFSKTWTFEECPNIMRRIFADGLTKPTGVTPTFNYEHRVSFIEVIGADGSVMTRNIISTQSDNTLDKIYSYFYINPFDAIGEWKEVRFYGGHNATFTHGSGVLIDAQALSMNKNELEGIQIMRTDIKGW